MGRDPIQHFFIPLRITIPTPGTLFKVSSISCCLCGDTWVMPMLEQRASGTQGGEQRPEGQPKVGPSGPQPVCHHTNPKHSSTKTGRPKGQMKQPLEKPP